MINKQFRVTLEGDKLIEGYIDVDKAIKISEKVVDTFLSTDDVDLNVDGNVSKGKYITRYNEIIVDNVMEVDASIEEQMLYIDEVKTNTEILLYNKGYVAYLDTVCLGEKDGTIGSKQYKYITRGVYLVNVGVPEEPLNLNTIDLSKKELRDKSVDF